MTPAPYRVMTVCTGNICRSPMAEIVLRERFAAAGLDVVVDSTGVSAEESGNPIDRRAGSVLVDHDYDAGRSHRARQVQASDLAQRDLVLAMTAQHAGVLRRLAGSGRAGRVRMYRSFDPGAPVDGLGGAMRDGAPERLLDVADPWYGGYADFEDCLAEIEAAADGVVRFVRGEIERRAAR